MKNLSLNFKDGMFLGKQELEKQNLLSQSLSFSFRRLFVEASNNYNYGLFNPSKMKIRGAILVNKIAFCADNLNGGAEESLGRLIVGRNSSGDFIGLPLSDGNDSHLLGKEAIISASSYPSGSVTRYVYFSAAETHYEPTLITINANGTGILGLSSIQGSLLNLFRQNSQGRYTKIKTEGNQILTVQSFNEQTGIITFSETSITAETNVQFMFVHTLSPLVSGTAEPIYTYPSVSIDMSASSTEGTSSKFLVAEVDFENGVPTSVSIEGSFGVEPNYKWMDTIGKEQISSSNIAENSILESHIGDDAVTSSKIEDDAVTSSKIEDDAILKRHIADRVIPTRQIYSYSDSNPRPSYVLNSNVLGQIVIIDLPSIPGGSTYTHGIFYNKFSDLNTQALQNAKFLEMKGQEGSFICKFSGSQVTDLLLFDTSTDWSCFVLNPVTKISNAINSPFCLRFDYVITENGLLFESIKNI